MATAAPSTIFTIRGAILVVGSYAALISAGAHAFGAELQGMLPAEHRHPQVRSLLDRIERFLVVGTAAGAALAVARHLATWWLGTAFAPLWTVLIGLSNLLSHVSAPITVTTPVLVVYAPSGGWPLAVEIPSILPLAQLAVSGVVGATQDDPQPRPLGRARLADGMGPPPGARGRGARRAADLDLLIVPSEFEATRPVAIPPSCAGL